MRVEKKAAMAAVVLLFSCFAVANAAAEDKGQTPAGQTGVPAVESAVDSPAPEGRAVMAQAPADPNAQMLQDIKVYPCF